MLGDGDRLRVSWTLGPGEGNLKCFECRFENFIQIANVVVEMTRRRERGHVELKGGGPL